MGLMDLLKTSDPMEKFYAAAEKSNIPQGGVTGAAFKSMFPYGLGNKAFGREPDPMPDMASPQGTQVMAELVQNVVGPGTFIGPKGLARLFGDDAAKGMLATAESKLASGVPRESVFQELGVFKGPEWKWRYEIDDSGMTGIRGGMGSYGVPENPEAFVSKVGDAVNHDTLFAAHPSLRYMNLEVNPAHNTLGSHYEGNIALKGDVSTQREWVTDAKRLAEEFAQNDFKAGDFGSLKEALDYHNAEFAKDAKYGDLSSNDASTLIHELQHAVQGKEDFARGGSPQMFSGASEMVNNISGDMKIAPDVVEFWRRVDSGTPRKQAGEGLDRNAVINALGFSDSLEARTWAGELEKQMNEWSDIAIDPFSAYQRLAGEAEARAVQDRMNMPMPERRSIFPDYAKRDDLIIRGLMSDAGH